MPLYSEFIFKDNVDLKSLLQQDILETVFMVILFIFKRIFSKSIQKYNQTLWRSEL